MTTIPLDHEIITNGCTIYKVDYTTSVEDHYNADENLSAYLTYVVKSLNGQCRPVEEVDKYEEDVYKIASNMTAVIDGSVPAQSSYRETFYHLYPETGTIRVFHFCSIREEQYEERPESWKIAYPCSNKDEYN